MSNFGEFLSKLGNLHDCSVTLFEWKPDKASMGFEIEDLHFNFEGFPEYKGPMPGRIELEGLQHVDIVVSGIEGPLTVYEFSLVEESPDASVGSITFWPSGRISVVYRQAVFPGIPLP